jgi:DNA primase
MAKQRRLDFKAIRDEIRIEQVCDWLGIIMKKTGTQLRGACPICKHDSSRCLVVTPALNRFWCFGSCHRGGDVIELVARVKQLSTKDAARLLVDHFGSS